MLRWILFIAFVIIVELYAFQAIKTVTKVKWILLSYQIISLLIVLYIIYSFTQFDRSVGQNKQTLFTFGLIMLVYIPKITLLIFMLGEDIVRITIGIVKEFLGNSNESFLPDRRKFMSQIALGAAALPFISILYGITKGKYNYKVIRQTLFFPDLPESFDGMTITQISDLHCGSFDDAKQIEYGVDLINQQQSDMILFTGDIVNTHASEMYPWIETFKKINPTKYGNYSVLGNHDYGEYITWPSQKAKQENFESIKNLHSQIGFKLLLNEHIKIKKDEQEIVIVGVENWGHNFKQAGDLTKASEGLTKNDFKILLSHDPSHWEHEIKDNPENFQLTLSGHTHGLQFGIEIPGFIKWSPVQYVYKYWAGMYEKAGRYLYVNRGFGFHAYPGRVGIWPEITVIELKKG